MPSGVGVVATAIRCDPGLAQRRRRSCRRSRRTRVVSRRQRPDQRRRARATCDGANTAHTAACPRASSSRAARDRGIVGSARAPCDTRSRRRSRPRPRAGPRSRPSRPSSARGTSTRRPASARAASSACARLAPSCAASGWIAGIPAPASARWVAGPTAQTSGSAAWPRGRLASAAAARALATTIATWPPAASARGERARIARRLGARDRHRDHLEAEPRERARVRRSRLDLARQHRVCHPAILPGAGAPGRRRRACPLAPTHAL